MFRVERLVQFRSVQVVRQFYDHAIIRGNSTFYEKYGNNENTDIWGFRKRKIPKSRGTAANRTSIVHRKLSNRK